jgi:hypothetical protein
MVCPRLSVLKKFLIAFFLYPLSGATKYIPMPNLAPPTTKQAKSGPTDSLAAFIAVYRLFLPLLLVCFLCPADCFYIFYAYFPKASQRTSPSPHEKLPDNGQKGFYK